MSQLYPESQPFATHELKVDEIHTIYIEEFGNPQGIPLIFLHGGPGAGCWPFHSRYFDPDIYRIVLFDQRGCGKSTPFASLEDNTTWHLVADIECLRQYLNIEKWVVFGGSWGSTLALLYAQAHPDSVSGLILRGIFLARDKDVNWFYQEGTSRLFPDYWQQFIAPIPLEERSNMVEAYYRQLTGENEMQRLRAAKAWSIWEGKTATLKINDNVVGSFSSSHAALSIARIECHYFMHQCWLTDNQILNNMDKINHIPGYIIHGRYDVICPAEQAWELSCAWPKAELSIIAESGHAIVEQGITDALLDATQDMAKKLK